MTAAVGGGDVTADPELAAGGAAPVGEAAAGGGGGREKTEFAKRNPHLEKLVPDAIENFVDKMIPQDMQRKMNRHVRRAGLRYQHLKTDFNEGFGEIAAVLFRVAKYAASRFNLGDIVFGVYHLADHHNKNRVVDAVEGKRVDDPDLVKWLIYCTDMAVMSYCPSKEQLCEGVGIKEEDIAIFQPKADAKRPAYTVLVDHDKKKVIWGFRGTTDLSDMLTDACASCTPYMDGYAHWGMLEAAEWFVNNELKNVRAVLDANPGYQLLLVGHSLGAGVACLLAHWLKNNKKAAAVVEGVDFKAIGVATPAVLTAEMAEGCSDYVTSVVLMHDVVPRFSIHNVFEMKREMDDTKWGDILAERIKDWMVPDVIEKSETYQRLTRHVSKSVDSAFKRIVGAVARFWINLVSAIISCLHFGGCIKPNKELQQSAKDGAGGSLADKARRMANATGRTAAAAMHDRSVVSSAAAHVQEEMKKVAHEDVHAVYAPGRLFFLQRHDPENDSDGGDDDDGPAAGVELVKDGEETDEAKAAAAAAAAKMERKRKEREKREARKREEADRKKREKEAAKRGEAPPPEAAEPYPGASFELVEGTPQQRFKRIVLRETCLMDHLCGGYIQGLEYALKSLEGSDAAQQQPAPTPAAGAAAK